MRKPDNLEATLSELKSFSDYLNKLIGDGSFYQLPFRERYRHIKHVKQLYNRLRGPISDVKLGQILAAATVLAFIVPIKIGPGLKFTPAASLLMGCGMNTTEMALTTVVSQLVMSMAPTTLDRFELTISGADMDSIVESYSGDITEISIEVPAGEARQFDLTAVVDPAEHNSIISYHGSSTIDLIAGETVEIDLNMEPVPVEPSFAAPVQDPFGLSGLNTHSHLAFADLDGDGDLDLLAGDYEGYPVNGEVFRYFENTGAADTPSFAASVVDPFSLTGLYIYAYLSIGDLDTDGDMDILVGKPGDGYGEFHYFQNTGTVAAPNFAGYTTNPFGLVDTNQFAHPTLGDLDGDGDLDLLVGDYVSYPDYNDLFLYFENTGTADSPSFITPVQDPFGLTNVANDAVPALVDLDGDGDLDIMAGDQSGNFQYFENTGTASVPAFEAPVPDPFGLNGVATNAIPTFGDLDGDGDLDLLVGGDAPNIWYFENEAL